MLRVGLFVGLIIFTVSVAGKAGAEALHARPGQTVALGVAGAEVYYDETGGNFRVTAILTQALGSVPVRLVASLQPGQGLTISFPGPTGKPATEVHLTHSNDGIDIDITYPGPITN